ncbi:biotin transporter BioY [Bacillus cereus]|uniref:biotin transporter BioY n=1 Tax=Bacillus TaxID=1386 RepID=UPI0007F15535|nr:MULTISPECIES: biotin transporter BioY [Bacillus]ANN31581.1 biotin transporter BioY [Bacillus thuringiensis serovar coreanensis]NIE89757.1 biotin transporter BioY [Bacillus sp. Ab-1751]MBE5090907.1 biotin transporter BioY [Bacillus thuringiensis]PEA96305.1 biotin transporter BioY [Bacillus cereus]PEB97875.1 biotin transporter BioY [Bacillus cereus]
MKKGGSITKKRLLISSLCIAFILLWSYKEEVFATFKPIDQYELNKELKNKSIENLTHNEMKKVGEHFVTEQLSVFGSTNKEDVKRKGEELFLNRGYEQLMGNYYPNRFRDLEYKFTNEEVREETDESFLYQAVAYVAGTENGKRSEMKLNYEVKIVKVNNIFMVLEQKQRVQ